MKQTWLLTTVVCIKQAIMKSKKPFIKWVKTSWCLEDSWYLYVTVQLMLELWGSSSIVPKPKLVIGEQRRDSLLWSWSLTLVEINNDPQSENLPVLPFYLPTCRSHDRSGNSWKPAISKSRGRVLAASGALSIGQLWLLWACQRLAAGEVMLLISPPLQPPCARTIEFQNKWGPGQAFSPFLKMFWSPHRCPWVWMLLASFCNLRCWTRRTNFKLRGAILLFCCLLSFVSLELTRTHTCPKRPCYQFLDSVLASYGNTHCLQNAHYHTRLHLNSSFLSIEISAFTAKHQSNRLLNLVKY